MNDISKAESDLIGQNIYDVFPAPMSTTADAGK